MKPQSLIPLTHLTSQNERMQQRLASLGFAMALEPLPRLKGVDPNTLDSDDLFSDKQADHTSRSIRQTTSSHTISKSAQNSVKGANIPSSPFKQRPLKRPRVEPTSPQARIGFPASRDTMPPPPRPMSRLKSMRKALPALRKKFLPSNPIPPPSPVEYDSKMEDNAYTDTNACGRDYSRNCAALSAEFPTQGPCMSGALPVERPFRFPDRQDSELLAKVGISDGRSDFTFRASSPVKTNVFKSIPLPTEPSYIRLMDGLSSDNGLELGLKDPRDNNPQTNDHHRNNEQVNMLSEHRRNPKELETRKRWNSEHPFLQQSPNVSLTSINDGMDASFPDITATGNPHRAFDHPEAAVAHNIRRKQLSDRPVESVVSPFFDSNRQASPAYAISAFTEPQDSFNRSDAYRSHRRSMKESRKGWDERLSLNGLSFFEKPVHLNHSHVHSTYRHPQNPTHVFSSKRSDTHNFASRGIFDRLKASHASSSNNGSYGFPVTQSVLNKKLFKPNTSNVRHTAVKGQSYNDVLRFSSKVPSIVTSQAMPRSQSQWEPLHQAGVRSSQMAYNHVNRDGLISPNIFRYSNVGRRSVRR